MKKLKVDNPLELKKGDLIAVSGFREGSEEPETPYSFDEIMMGHHRRKRETVFDGKPWRVIAISMPWVLATDGIERACFDTRRTELTLVSKEYARNWRAKEAITQKTPIVIGKIKNKKKKRHPSECPRCETRMSQILKDDRSGWQWVCKSCGFKGPDIPPVGE